MEPKKLLASLSRQFLQNKKVFQRNMKKVADMTDDEVISSCHFYCEENQLTAEWNTYREKAESEFSYCPYFEQYIDKGFCYDLQMIIGGFVSPTVLPEVKIDKVQCAKHCATCKYIL